MQQVIKHNLSRRPSATAPQVAPVKISWTLLTASLAVGDKASNYTDGSILTETTPAETAPL